MVNYANSKVYKIWSTQGDKIYVGSTTKLYLSKRMDAHRSKYKSFNENKYHFITSFELFEEYGLDNCCIELLEAKECKSKDELRQLEGKYIRELECVNKRVEGRTKKEYYKDNKESIVQYKKDYYKDNKVEVLKHVKEFYEENKTQILQYQKEYYESNKDKILERQNKKYDCECGGKYTHIHKSYHLKTTKHCKYIESQTTNPE
jgi:hypothetical protein